MDTRTSISYVAATLAALSQGCTGGSKGKAGRCDFQFGTGGPIAQFHRDADCAPNPWPSDRVLVDGVTTGLPASRASYMLPDTPEFDTARDYMQQVADGLDADGWSTIAPIQIVLDREPDLATVGAGVHLFTLDAGTPVADATVLAPSWDADLNALLLQPQTPFDESRTYGVVVTSDLLDTQARPTARSREFQRYLAAGASQNDLALYQGSGLPADRIALAFSFTTGTATADMVAIRDLVFAAPAGVHAPAYQSPSSFAGLTEGVFLSTSAEFSAAIGGYTTGSNLGAVAIGSFDSWDFRGADLGSFDAELVAGTATPPASRLDFRLTIPAGTPPAGGWPVVLYAHGLGGSNTDAFQWGNALAPYGFAVIGVSAVQHGYRGTVPGFFDWNSMPATRESFRQTYADHLQVLRMMREGKDAGLPPFDRLDVNDVSYFGISLGGIMGSAFLSLAPYNRNGLLVVPGGHLTRELHAQTVGQTYLFPFIANRAGIAASAPEFQVFLKGFDMLVQIGLDKADPVNFATHVVTPGNQLPSSTAKRVLQTISTGDTWVPNDANQALRRALGIPELTAATTDAAGVSGAWVLDDVTFPQVSGQEPHGYFSLLCEAQEMGFHWLASDATEVLDPSAVSCP